MNDKKEVELLFIDDSQLTFGHHFTKSLFKLRNNNTSTNVMFIFVAVIEG